MGSGRNSKHYYNENYLQYSGQQTIEQYTKFDDLVHELDALEQNNSGSYKHDSDSIISITKDPNGKIKWLEKGNSTAGYAHIIKKHEDEFLTKGIEKYEVPNYIMTAISQGTVVGKQRTRNIYKFVYNGKKRYIAIEIGTNGFVVGANPKSDNWEDKK